MKFVASFSTGKDSVLALHRMVKAGHEPLGLIVMYNKDAERSWFHGAGDELLQEIGNALGIPVFKGVSSEIDYNDTMETLLKSSARAGARACVFGDIDMEGHRQWNEERCRAAGLEAVMPLWGDDREKLVYEVIDAGYKCVIKCVKNGMLPECFVGKLLSRDIVDEMRRYDVDLCGENGEYHTIAVNGPIFKRPVRYALGDLYKSEYVTAVDIKPAK